MPHDAVVHSDINWSSDPEMQRSDSSETELHQHVGGKFECGGANRYIILALATLFLASLMSSVVAFNASYVSLMDKPSSPLYTAWLNMTEEERGALDWESAELPLADRRFSFTTIQKSLSFAGAFAGSLFGTQPINMMADRIGAHKTMAAIGIISSAIVVATPHALGFSFPLFVALRFISGASISNLFPLAGRVVEDWASVAEKGFFIAVLSGHVEVSPVFSMPMSGIIAKNFGWPWVFYIHGIICAVFTTLWILYYRDRPSSHPFVGESECAVIKAGKQPKGKKNSAPSTPYREICTSLPIWAVWLAVISNFMVIQFAISFTPMYLSYVLGYSPSSSGLLMLIPLGALLVVKFATGLVSDKLTEIREVTKMRVFNTLALLGSGLFFLVVSVVAPRGTVIDVALIAIPLALLGFHAGGYPKCAVVVSQQHSPFVMSIVQMIACGSLLGSAFLVPAMTPTSSYEEWRSVFALYAGVLVVANTIFVMFAKGEAAPWTLVEEARQEKMNRARTLSSVHPETLSSTSPKQSIGG